MEEDLFSHIWTGLKRLREYRKFVAPAAEAIFSPLARSSPERVGDSIRVGHLETVGQIIAGKHRVLRHYLNAWFPILARFNKQILFIDGFSGPGEYEGGEEGSPLIALRTLREHRAKSMVNKANFFFMPSE